MSEEDRKSPGQEEVDEGAPFPPDEDEEEEEFVGRRRSGASRGFNASSFIDDQAEVSEDEAEIGRVAGDEEEDEGEEGDEQEVAQGFIVDEAEESGEEDIPEEKFADEPIELIDDDLDLIAENLGIRLKQKRKPSDSQESGAPKRRLQKIASRSADYEIEEEEFSDEDDYRTSRLDSMASIREQDELIEEREALGIGKGDIFRIFGDVSDFLREGNTAASIPLEELQPHVRAVVETGKPKSKITSSQELVISTDLPERYFKRDFTPEDCLEEERDWIRESFIDGLSFDGLPQSRRQAIETSLSKVLSFINLDKYEITYIGLYLEDYYKDFCDAESLWKILDLDDKFSTFLKRREALHKLALDKDPGFSRLLALASDENDLDDIRDYLEAFNPKSSTDSVSIRKKLSRRMSLIPPISEHAQPLVDVLFPKFDEIVECIYLQRAFSGSSPDITPNEYCQLNNLTLNSGMSFDELTDSIVKHCIAKLAVQPLIRKFARSFFRRHAVVTTSPLPGKQEISDPSHQYYQIHNLRAKPVSEFEESFRTQFLTIDRAAGEGFITVDISLPQGEDDAFLSKCLAPFLEDKGNMAWNDIRFRIMQSVLIKFIFPLCQNFVSNHLLQSASAVVCQEAAIELSHMLKVKPKSRSEKIMAATSGTESTPSYFVMLDPDGNVLDHLELHFLLDFGKKSEGDFDGRKKDSKKLQQFVEIHEPTLLVIDASVRAKKFKETLEDSLRGSQIEIQYLDPSVSRIYSMSLRSKTEFFEYSDLHRFTVSLGRFILDPLPEICALATKNNDLLSLDLHESQKFVNADMLIKYLKRAIINYVSRVGVDLNYINVQRHKSAVLEFVPGLGPHKARHILSRISKKGFLSSRLELLAEGLVGPNVFRNCVGFIRIRPPSQYVSIEFPLIDDTRIHPDDYELADSFIINALDLHTSIHSDEERNKYIEKIRSPSGMKELDKLDLDLYAIELEKRDGKKKAMILKMIASELKYPFKDLARKSFSRYTPEKLFGLLTGEIVGRTIKKGQLVLVTITRISPDGIRCKLDGNVFGFIPASEVSDTYDSRAHHSLQDFLSTEMGLANGQALKARIKNFHFEKLEVELSCRRSTVEGSPRFMESQAGTDRDIYLYPVTEQDRNSEVSPQALGDSAQNASVGTQAPVKRFVQRQINHPSFRNVTTEEAEQILRQSKDPLAAIVHPSYKGLNWIAVSVKASEDTFWHFELAESDKPANVMHSLGRVLKYDNRKFEDLDEFIATYVIPVLSITGQVVSDRHFRYGGREELKKILMTEAPVPGAKRNIPFYFGFFGPEHPGFMVLSWMPSRSVRTEVLKVLPEGIRLGETVHSSVRKMIEYFKQNFKKFLQGPSRSDHDQSRQLPSETQEWSRDRAYADSRSRGYGREEWDDRNYRRSDWDQHDDWRRPAHLPPLPVSRASGDYDRDGYSWNSRDARPPMRSGYPPESYARHESSYDRYPRRY